MTRAILLIMLFFVIPASYFGYKVLTFDLANEPKGTLIHSPVFTQSVKIARNFWTERGQKIPCSTIRGYVVESIPSVGRRKDAGVITSIPRKIFYRRGWYVRAIKVPAAFCTVTTHEMGHIVGLGHDPRPNSIMHTPTSFTLSDCT